MSPARSRGPRPCAASGGEPTIPLSAAAKQCKKIKVLSVARLLGESIRRIHHGDSISSLFI